MKDERLNSFVWSRVLYLSALNAVFYPVSLILFQDIHLFSIKHCAKEQNTVNWQTRLTKWQEGTDKKEVRSPGRTMSFRVEGCFNSPASPKRRGEAMSSGHRGKGAGWYVRHQAAKRIKEKDLLPSSICQSHPAILSVSSANLPYFALWHNV